MKTRLTLISTALFATLTLAACGGSSGGGGGTGVSPSLLPQEGDSIPKDGQTIQPKDCETQWQERVAKAPIGQIKVHDIVEVTTGSGVLGLDGTIRSRSREEVLSASEDVIVTATRWEYFEPKLGTVDGENRLTKENFMFTCEPITGEVTSDPEGLARAGVTILEDRTESIQVQAGTFEARYEKIHVKGGFGLGSEVFGDHWTMKDDTVIVKEKIVVTSPNEDGTNTIKTTERQLIEYVPPTK